MEGFFACICTYSYILYSIHYKGVICTLKHFNCMICSEIIKQLYVFGD